MGMQRWEDYGLPGAMVPPVWLLFKSERFVTCTWEACMRSVHGTCPWQGVWQDCMAFLRQ